MTKQRYRIREGADTIDGERVPEDRIVEMTEQAADYYVAIAAASLANEDAAEEKAPRKRRSKAPTKTGA
ncbi:hypothetical protein PsAD13_03236 [Pseudovibrio sp. Ad13]|uniref:hypothetical protein n=1 Tax=unclassified Pseudovibrio TaxID=2627060 RepID=UPI0007AEDF26|nr:MULTISPECIES: hypothetical protein [unclassified Pseudovibrio]KZK83034.1 hypothetical protein PsAD13_03236 [Pseudovibrio sp. Ad13]KZK97939.1 hypothetical protein PsAD5_02178 [Pseudovibrio sp. Ad5]